MKKTGIVILLTLSGMIWMISPQASAATLLGHWAMDEGSGTLLADSSGNGYDGTLISGTWTQDRFGLDGKAIFLNNNKIDIPNNVKAETVTLSAWINPTHYGSTSGPACIFSSETGHGATGFVWRLALINDGILRMEAIAPSGGTGARLAQTATEAIPLNEWHHVAGSYDGTTVKVFIDGQLAASTPYTTEAMINTTDTIPSTIGYMSWGLQYFGGSLDDARIYDGAMSNAEVASVAAGDVVPGSVVVNAGQACYAGRIAAVELIDLLAGSFKLQIAVDEGLWTDIDSGVYTAGPVYWKIPQGIDSDNCRIRVITPEEGFIFVESDLFSIRSCSVTADLTGDCFVDFQDFLQLAEQWLTGENEQ